MNINNEIPETPVYVSNVKPSSPQKPRLFPKINSGGHDSILASFYGDILTNLGIFRMEWDRYMKDYLHDKRNGIPQNNRDLSSARGNIYKELSKQGMTWKVFVKGLRFIKINKFELVLRAYHSNGKISEHSKVVNVGTEMEDD